MKIVLRVHNNESLLEFKNYCVSEFSNKCVVNSLLDVNSRIVN